MNPPQGIRIVAAIKYAYVTILENSSFGSVAHGIGIAPLIIGRPNPDKLDGLNSIGYADDIDIFVSCDSPVSSDTIFTVLYK